MVSGDKNKNNQIISMILQNLAFSQVIVKVPSDLKDSPNIIQHYKPLQKSITFPSSLWWIIVCLYW